MFIGGKHLHCNFKPMTNSSFISENLDQELSLDDLQNTNGGLVWWLVGAMLLIPLVANAPSHKDDKPITRGDKNNKFYLAKN